MINFYNYNLKHYLWPDIFVVQINPGPSSYLFRLYHPTILDLKTPEAAQTLVSVCSARWGVSLGGEERSIPCMIGLMSVLALDALSLQQRT